MDLGHMVHKRRIEECREPQNKSCRYCDYSFNPELYDGGCKLMYSKKFKRKHRRRNK